MNVRKGMGGDDRGFSLLEIAICIGLLSIMLLGIFAMFTQGMYVLSHSKQVDGATEQAHECLETIRALGVGSIVVGTYDARNGDPPVSGFPPPPYLPAPADNPMFVEATTVGAPANTISVKVEVYFEQNRKVSLQTYFNI